MNIDNPSTMTPLLKRLEAAGFIKRERHATNKRQMIASLTEKGKEAKSYSERLKQALLRASGLSSAELTQLNETMRNLRDNLK